MAKGIKIEVGLDTKQAERDLQAFKSRFASAVDASTRSVNELRSSLGALRTILGGLGLAAGVATIKQFADAAIQAAVSIDRQVNSLRALTGSAEAATRRFRE